MKFLLITFETADDAGLHESCSFPAPGADKLRKVRKTGGKCITSASLWQNYYFPHIRDLILVGKTHREIVSG